MGFAVGLMKGGGSVSLEVLITDLSDAMILGLAGSANVKGGLTIRSETV